VNRIEIQDILDTLEYAERMERIAQTFLQWHQATAAGHDTDDASRLMADLTVLADEELRHQGGEHEPR
jgi:hypothetical protein